MKLELLNSNITDSTQTVVEVATAQDLIAAYNTTKENVKSNTKILLTSDLYLADKLSFANSINKVVIDGGGHKIYGASPAAISTSGNYIKVSTTHKAKFIVVNGAFCRMIQAADYHYTGNLYVSHYDTSDGNKSCRIVTIDGVDYMRIKTPSNFPALSTNANAEYGHDAYVQVIDRWYTRYAEIKGFDLEGISGYMYLTLDSFENTHYLYDSTYRNIRLRLLNEKTLIEPGQFYREASASGYNIYYYPLVGETVESIAVVDQEELINIDKCCNLTIQNCKLVGNDSLDSDRTQAGSAMNSAVTVTDSANIDIRENEFTGIGGFAVYIKKGCQRCYAQSNYIHDTYGGGIHVSGVSDSPAYFISIYDNVIKGIGRYIADCCGILVRYARNIQIKNNTVCDTFYTGISVGWSWGFQTSSCGNYIAYNHVHHCIQLLLSDGGGMYFMGQQPDTVIECNSVHDIYGFENDCQCIYNENGSSGLLVRYNILYSSQDIVGLGGEANVYYNNIIAYPLNAGFHASYNTGRMAIAALKNLVLANTFADAFWVDSENLATLNVIQGGDIEEAAAMFNNYKHNIPFRNSSDGDFYITDNFAFGTYLCTSADNYVTTITYGVMNNAQFGTVTQTDKESLGNLVYNDNTVTYENYYKKVTIDAKGITNDYLNNN